MSRTFNSKQIPYYKHLHTGTKPKNTVVDRENSDKNITLDNISEREIGSEVSQENNLLPEFPENQPNLSSSPIQSLPSENSVTQDFDLLQPTGSHLPEGPPSQSPLPPGWGNRGPFISNRDPRNIPDDIHRPFRNSYSEPTSPRRRNSVIECPIITGQKLRSPF